MRNLTMNDRTVGWAFVGVQIVLLGALILLPGSDHWPTPRWLHQASSVVNLFGLALVVVAGLGLGSALTPTPVPRQAGQLSTGGLYRLARHPIYTGVLLIVIALTAASGSGLQAIIGLITFGFFIVKARWEEQRLRVQYPQYAAYAEKTARFFPYIY